MFRLSIPNIFLRTVYIPRPGLSLILPSSHHFSSTGSTRFEDSYFAENLLVSVVHFIKRPRGHDEKPYMVPS